MPIYEYQCQYCGHQFEKLQKISDPQLKDCPQCSKPELRKLISAAGFQLKGSGWYETDFRGSKKGSASSKSSSPKKESNSETTTNGTASGTD